MPPVSDHLEGLQRASFERVRAFLEAWGAKEIPHPGGTLFSHLVRTRDLLVEWGARGALSAAGLCHAAYGTDGFEHALLELGARADLVSVIGPHAEQIVYRYASCDRRFLYPQLGNEDIRFRDRFTDDVVDIEPAALQDFMELTFANEVDVARHNKAFAAREWPLLARIFNRCQALVSSAAWDAYLRARPTERSGRAAE